MKTVKNKIATGILALALLAGVAPPATAQTPTTAELQARIAELLASINALQAKITPGHSGSMPSACPYTWSRSLTIGATGTDVMKLQQLLNTDPDTRVAMSGLGSIGQETSYFGPATAAAVAKFQAKHRSDILTPLGLVNATSFFGPSSIRKANALCITMPATPTTPTVPSTPTTPTTDDAGVTLRGEGTLGTFEISNADEREVEEAGSDITVAEVTLEARDGDIEISRLDIALIADSGNTERDPWDTFETVSLWIDGDKIAEERVDNRNDYLNRNLGTVRFSNLNLILEENEDVEMLVAVSVQNNVRGAGTSATWSVSVERLRYFDGDRVATDDSTTGELGDRVSFNIIERGENNELKFSVGTNNPESKHIIVDTTRRTNNVTLLEYTIEALDADIELDTLYVNVETGTANFNDVVSDIRLIIGNTTFRKDTVLSTGSYTPTNVRVAFDIDGDITIDEDDKVRVRVVVDLKPQTAYANGETIIARITSSERDSTKAEGADDIAKFSGTVIGKQHTLVSEGIVIATQSTRFKTETQGQNNTIGTFDIEFEVTAIEGDFYIASNATTATATSSGGIRFTVESTAGEPTFTYGIVSSTAHEDNAGVFVIREGETEKFTLNVTLDASSPGQHRVILESIHYSSNDDGVTNVDTYTVTPLSKFRTPYLFINN